MSTDARLEGVVRAIGRGGDAIVETDRGVVLVPGALPGERIELAVEKRKRGARRGRLLRVLDPAGARMTPPCTEASRCGGCPLMIAEPPLQRDIKLGFLLEACRGLPGADAVEPRWVPSQAEYGYRRRARLAWHRGRLGYRRLHSRQVVDIERCMVLAAPLAAAWATTRRCLGALLRGEGQIQLELASADQVVVGLATRDAQPPEVFEACEELSRSEPIVGVTLRAAEDVAAARWGTTELQLGVGAKTMVIPAGGFAQANDAVNAALVETVIELAEPEGASVLELYSGAGNFTVSLAAAAPSRLVAVEQDAVAVEACRANLDRRGLHARVTAGDASDPPRGRYDVLVLDPPRQGARQLFEEGGLLPGPKRVVYVSCDTATLSRDLELATRTGYRIDRMIAFDMFPQTAHLESVVRLVRS